MTSHDDIVDAAFSPDNHILATASDDHTARLWDVSDPRQPHQLGALTGHREGVNLIAFSADGHTLATASDDATVILWDLTDLTQPTRLVPPLTGHTGSVRSVAFSLDGHTLATAGDDSKVILWDLTGLSYLRDHATEQACSRTGRGLDRDEWARAIPGLAYQDTCPA